MKNIGTTFFAYFLCVSAVVTGLAGCEEKGNNVGLLRSNDNTFYYAINNRDAIKRFSPIMYNRTDSLHQVERFKLVHISDPHLSGWSIDNHYAHPINLIESVTFANQEELKINAMVETGDHISRTSAKDARNWMTSFFRFLYQNNRIPTFSCYGNHDANIDNKEDYITANELGANVQYYKNHPIQKPGVDRSYYYADVPNPQGGVVRIIALDMLDQPGNEYNTLHYAVFSQEQIDWLGNVALKEEMTHRHSVIILTHFPVQISAWGGKSPGGMDASGTPFYLYDGNFTYTWSVIPDIVEAFRTRSSVQRNYPNIVYPNHRGIQADFDFTNAAGEFVCYLGGHVHCFALFDVRGTSDTLPPQKMIICTNQSPSEAGSVYNKVVRKESSLISNSFNMYAIDTHEKKVYITFFGACIPFDAPTAPTILEFSYL
ncbi:MAG: metallophosphoesterase [Tannerellaceae bacterium]|jgi:predicted MPP superfamily phosphohydrolase|nr:metallophosphoesterase [Tannerellaceae bacterium]